MPESCIRCGRVAPDVESGEYSEWEVVDDDLGNLVMRCPDCLTQDPIDEDAFAMADEVTVLSTEDDIEDTDP